MSMRNEIVKIEKEKLDYILDELDTLSKYFDERIVELHKSIGGQADKHAFTLYRSIVCKIERELKSNTK